MEGLSLPANRHVQRPTLEQSVTTVIFAVVKTAAKMKLLLLCCSVKIAVK